MTALKQIKNNSEDTKEKLKEKGIETYEPRERKLSRDTQDITWEDLEIVDVTPE